MGEKMTDNSVQLSVKDGVATIEQGTALTRLHYFDGKFLRADALTLEQDYHRNLVRLSNLAGGWGVVHGLGISLASEQLSVTPGLAITPAGSTVLLGNTFTVAVNKLIDAAAPAPSNPTTPGVAGSGNFADCPGYPADSISTSANTGYYEITVGPVEGLCGNEEVYGKLCEDACVTDSQSPYWKEGLVLRLRPITLNLPSSTSVLPSANNLRNRVVSAYFASEPWLTASLLSATGLNSQTWCNPAMMYNRDEVPIGLLVRNGTSTQFIDAWGARRERMDTQARGYWQGRMMMRPWNVFIAQILQFQCQLSGVFKPGSTEFDPMDDDCKKLRALLGDSLRELEMARKKYEAGNQKIMKMLGDNSKAMEEMESPYKHFDTLTSKLADAQESLTQLPQNRMLINAGFVQLPPAGYLPVVPGKQAINEQLQRMFGEGVNLHFCTARPDFIPHALEEDQHMERISLTRGLDNPAQKEEVEIFVPNGEIIDALGTQDGTYWLAEMNPAMLEAFDLNFKKAKAEDIILMQSADAPKAEAVPMAAPEAPAPAAAGTGTGTETFEMMKRVEDANKTSKDALEAALQDKQRYQRNPLFNAQILEGIARTSRLDNGGAAITMVCQFNGTLPDTADTGTSDTSGNIRGYRMMKNMMPGPITHLDEQGNANSVNFGPIAIYVDLRITQNPFAQKEGDEIPLSFEFCALSQDSSNAKDDAQRGIGILSIETIIELQANIIGVEALVRIGSGSDAMEIPVRMTQEGNSKTGHFTVAMGTPANVYTHVGYKRTWAAEWSGVPRDAVFGLETSSSTGLYQAGLRNKQSNLNSYYETGTDYPVTEKSTIRPAVKLHESETPFKPESTIRLAALNTLAEMADAIDEPAFLARARGRLFPDTATDKNTVSVRANLDWVMFRRQRKAICDTSCKCEPTITNDSYKTWHLKLDDVGELDILKQAIDHDQLDRLKGRFKFKMVDVLHYADAALNPVEKLNAIQTDWENANPGQTVLLGRIWETSPEKGQGAQNLLRLKRLVKLLDGTLDFPGAGVLLSMQKPPQPLKDTQFDGGMLLVTADVEAPTQVLHRVYIVSAAQEQEELGVIQSQGGKGIYDHLEKYAVKTMNLHINAATNAPDATELAALKTTYDAFQPMATETMVLVGKSATSSANAKAQFEAICNGIQRVPGIPGTGELFNVEDNDFGSGIPVATVIYFNVEDK